MSSWEEQYLNQMTGISINDRIAKMREEDSLEVVFQRIKKQQEYQQRYQEILEKQENAIRKHYQKVERQKQLDSFFSTFFQDIKFLLRVKMISLLESPAQKVHWMKEDIEKQL